MNHKIDPLASGYLLLPPSSVRGYSGVCRWPGASFAPCLEVEFVDLAKAETVDAGHFWEAYPPGWRRDAYRLFEENLDASNMVERFYALSLLSSYSIASRIRAMVQTHVGILEIVHCAVYEVGVDVEMHENATDLFHGYDVAFPGGDLFSAVASGLFELPDWEPDTGLIARYAHLLNRHGLFASSQVTGAYLEDFRSCSEGYRDDDFVTYAVTLCP